MSEEHTTAVVRRSLDEPAGDSPAELLVQVRQGRAVCRVHLLSATLLSRSHPRRVQSRLNV
jgi:hypothetical protein